MSKKHPGKRERQAKAAIVSANLKQRPVVSTQVIRTKAGHLQVIKGDASIIHRDNLHTASHTPGFRGVQRNLNDTPKDYTKEDRGARKRNAALYKEGSAFLKGK